MAKRRQTSQDKKKTADTAAANPKIEEPIGDPIKEIEDPAAAAASAAAPEEELGDLDESDPGPEPREPADPDEPRGIFRNPPRLPVTTPNKPSFDWTKEGKKKVPNLIDGEEVVSESKREGLTVVRTSRTRFIYLCTAEEYEKAFGLLPSRQIFEEAFPHAFTKKKAAKK